MACTVLEEGDADRMLAEMVRVTRPGGRVAVIVRTIDVPWVVNLPLRAALKEGGDPRVVLELLKDAAPTLSRIAVLRNESEPDDAARRQIEAAARTLKLEVKEFLVGHAKDLAPTFAAMGQARVVINLKTAKALGLTIPQTLLQRADQIIE